MVFRPKGGPLRELVRVVPDVLRLLRSIIGDRSVPLDIAISRIEDLKHDILQWVEPSIQGKESINGTEAAIVKAFWKPYGDWVGPNHEKGQGTFQMDIADDGRLIRYVVQQLMSDGSKQVTVTSIWDVNLTVNGKPDPNLFRVSQ